MAECTSNTCTEYLLEDSIGFVSGRTFLAINRKLQQNFREKTQDITAEQWCILVQLWNTDGLCQQALAQKTGRDKPSVTRLVDTLEKNEFVVRVPDKEDRRFNLVYLTPKGKEIQIQLTQIAKDTLEQATQGISKEELEIAKRVLNSIYSSILATSKCEKDDDACVA